jgi:hypothetical protein
VEVKVLVEEAPLFQETMLERLEDLVVEELILVLEEQVIHLLQIHLKVMLEEMEMLVANKVHLVVVELQLLEQLPLELMVELEVQEHLTQF